MRVRCRINKKESRVERFGEGKLDTSVVQALSRSCGHEKHVQWMRVRMEEERRVCMGGRR